MDKVEQLKQLLSDPEIKSIVKEILQEEKSKPKRGRPRKTVDKTAKEPVKKFKKTTNKNDPNYGREEPFVDDLSFATIEVIEDGDTTREYNLIELSKKIKGNPNKVPRKQPKLKKKTCVCGKKFECYGMEYLCPKCIGGRSA